MKWIMLLFVFLLPGVNNKVSAQTYLVTYSRDYDASDSIKNFPEDRISGNYSSSLFIHPWVYKTIFNDSFSLSDYLPLNNDITYSYKRFLKKKKLPFAWVNYIKNDSLYLVRYSYKRKEKVYLLDTLPSTNWVYDTTEYGCTMFNYKCKLAYTLQASGDTTFVLYTKDLPGRFGPLWIRGLQGCGLAFFQQGRKGISYIATKVEEINYEMKFPGDNEFITRREYDKRRKQ